jgi:ketosteroid isomerase-like protein
VPPSLTALAHELFERFSRGDVEGYVARVHPDATLRPVTGTAREVRGREAVRLWLQEAKSGGQLVISAHDVRERGDAVIVVGRVWQLQRGVGVRDSGACWRLVFRDGLLWRSDAFATVEDAVAASAVA